MCLFQVLTLPTPTPNTNSSFIFSDNLKQLYGLFSNQVLFPCVTMPGSDINVAPVFIRQRPKILNHELRNLGGNVPKLLADNKLVQIKCAVTCQSVRIYLPPETAVTS